ncbi:hypothetical protein D3C81_702640 [compost metagenome]
MKNSPTTVPMAAPSKASLLAPTFCAPITVDSTSITTEIRVSTPSTTSGSQPTRSKPSVQAATSRPMNTNGTPGRAGRMMPARPTTTSRPAIR